MASLACPKCGKSVPDNYPFCPYCGNEVNGACDSDSRVEGQQLNPMKSAAASPRPVPVICRVLILALCAVAVTTFFLGVYNLTTAYDKIDNYYNSETYPSLNENAYVGGDAYNYIINGTYFTGYAVQGMGYLLIATTSAIAAVSNYMRYASPSMTNFNQAARPTATEKKIGSHLK